MTPAQVDARIAELDRIEKKQRTADEARELDELCAVFAAQPWQRYWATTGATGHIHRSMHCSTCNREGTLTAFVWMTDLSGKTVDEVVDQYGDRVCTVCWPDVDATRLVKKTEPGVCPGTGTFDWKPEGRRTTYYGAGGYCQHCGEWASQTRGGKIRKHQRP